MISLLQSERFQTEYKMYNDRIKNISDETVQEQATALLRNLINEVKKIDSQHQEMFSSNQLPTALGDARSGIVTLRKKIDTILKDWENSNSKEC
jgi:predicted nuclease with TOPRIM domain